MMYPMMNPMMGGGGGSKVSMLLLALAAGYAVLVLANKQERPLDVLGRILGGLILVVSFVGLLCVAICRIGCRMGACHKMDSSACSVEARKHCPFPAEAEEPSVPSTESIQNGK
jgi:hypothetical protein